MSENSQLSIGQVLRDAREAQGVSLEEVATRLRLMHRQIEAMETDDFESLGQPVFARGFVRNYARLLGLDQDELLARMEGAPAESAPVNPVEPPLPRSWLSSPWLLMLLLGVLAIVAVPVGLYLWLNSDADSIPGSVAPVAPTQSVPVVAQPAATVPDMPVAVDAPAVSTTDAAVTAEVAVPVAADATAPEAAVAATGSVMHLEFGEESWAEIKDASGRMLHRQLNPAGSSVDIQGKPPFEIVIGNAAQARMTYNGRPIDLKPFIAVTVARFTLEE